LSTIIVDHARRAARRRRAAARALLPRWRGLLLRCVLLLLGCACALDVVKLYSRLTQTRLCPRLLCCGC
jgi:hypothetical protein